MHPYKAAVFDVDGTLLDTSEGVLASVRYTIEYFGLEPLSERQLQTFIGPPIQNSFANTYGLKGAVLQEIATVFRNRYKDTDLLKAVAYEGIYEVFEACAENGIRTAVATYKRQDYAEAILRHFGFDRYTQILYGADHENKLKKRDIIQMALRDAGLKDLRQGVMIGDSDNDAIGAAEIGLPFLAVTYGFGFHSVADASAYANVGIAANTEQLKALLIGEKIS